MKPSHLQPKDLALFCFCFYFHSGERAERGRGATRKYYMFQKPTCRNSQARWAFRWLLQHPPLSICHMPGPCLRALRGWTEQVRLGDLGGDHKCAGEASGSFHEPTWDTTGAPEIIEWKLWKSGDNKQWHLGGWGNMFPHFNPHFEEAWGNSSEHPERHCLRWMDEEYVVNICNRMKECHL